MPTDQKIMLASKAQANAQRRTREKLLAALSSRNKGILERSSCVYSPDADFLLRRIMPISGNGVGTTPGIELHNFSLVETGKPQKLLQTLQTFGRSHDFEMAYVVIPGVEVIRFPHGTVLVPEYPVFRLQFGAAKSVLEETWNPKVGFCGAFTENFAAGILIDSYGDYCLSDPGPEECTYEMASWVA